MGHPARKSSTPWLIGDTAVGWKSSHQVCSVPRSPVALATGSSRLSDVSFYLLYFP